LETLKRQYGLKSYVRDGTLYVGFARLTQNRSFTEPIPRRTITLRFGRDIIDFGNLTYKTADEIDISLTCISIDENNERISVTAGESYGAQRTLYYYNLSEVDLQKIVDEEVDTFKYNGYRGTVTIFGVPQVKHGDAVRIINDDIKDYEGTYLVSRVVTRFGRRGFRQELTLGQRINE